MATELRRRDFLAAIAGASVARPLAAHAQGGARRLGVLMSLAEGDKEFAGPPRGLYTGAGDLGRMQTRICTSICAGARNQPRCCNGSLPNWAH